MYTRILVPLDGSTRAERSVPVAAALARASRGSVVLMQVIRVGGAYGPIVPSTYSGALADADRREAQAYLTSIAGLPALSGINTEVGVFTGPPAVSILDAATAYKADAIVITSHGRTGMSRWALGSVAEHVFRNAHIPVVVMREHGLSPAERQGSEPKPLRVLVPLDESPQAETALEPAMELAKALAGTASGTVHLLCVVAAGVDPMDLPMVEQATAKAKQYLVELSERLQAQQPEVHVTWAVASASDAASGILRVAERQDAQRGDEHSGGADLIALASHGRTGLKRWMVGSVAERVLHATSLPMLIVRSGGESALERAEEQVASPQMAAWPALF